MELVRRELHYAARGKPLCGQRGARVCVTDQIADVTCRKCAERNYRDAVLAHVRAFPEHVGPRGRRQMRAIRSLGIEPTRTGRKSG